MIDFQKDQLLGLGDVPKFLRELNGRRVSVVTVWRWCRDGVKLTSGRRLKLDHAWIGRKIVTSVRALQEFSNALTLDRQRRGRSPDDRISLPPPELLSPGRHDEKREAEIHKAIAELDAACAPRKPRAWRTSD